LKTLKLLWKPAQIPVLVYLPPASYTEDTASRALYFPASEAMADFLTDLFQNIFTPGAGRSLIIALNVAFVALQLTLGALVIGTYGDEWCIHFAAMSAICAGLWAAINWFAIENNKAVAQTEAERIAREREQDEQEQEKTEETDAETVIGTADTGSGSKEVEVVEQKGELIDRTAKTTSSGDPELSTDEDWEKVGPVGFSSEKNKDK